MGRWCNKLIKSYPIQKVWRHLVFHSWYFFCHYFNRHVYLPVNCPTCCWYGFCGWSWYWGGGRVRCRCSCCSCCCRCFSWKRFNARQLENKSLPSEIVYSTSTFLQGLQSSIKNKLCAYFRAELVITGASAALKSLYTFVLKVKTESVQSDEWQDQELKTTGRQHVLQELLQHVSEAFKTLKSWYVKSFNQ